MFGQKEMARAGKGNREEGCQVRPEQLARARNGIKVAVPDVAGVTIGHESALL